MGCVIGPHSITCYRSGPLKKAKIVLSDKQGNQWFCNDSKDKFDIYPDNRPVEIFTKEGITKKFLKGFLNFVMPFSEYKGINNE